MAPRLLIRLLVALPALVSGASVANAQGVGPDSLVILGNIEFANGNLDSSESLFRRALEPEHRAAAAIGLGRVMLERGNATEAARLFGQAETWERQKGHREYGEGIIAAKRGKKDEAKASFQAALRKDPRYADALVQVGRIQTQSMVERLSAKRTYRRALQIDPRHPSAHTELGILHERTGDVDEAIAEFETQLRINPNHTETLIHLGYALLDKGRYWHARQRFFQALLGTTGREAELTLALGATYMGDRQFARAHDAYAQALQIMPEEERTCYESIDDIATAQEASYSHRVSGEQRLIFIRKFWLRRDPTPVTMVNERLLEHFRRVWYARSHYSQGRQPWDDRGAVYIRYGEPDHVSTSRKPNFARSTAVDAVRDRYLAAIYGPNVPDVLSRGTLPAYPLIDPADMNLDDIGWSQSQGQGDQDTQGDGSGDTDTQSTISTPDLPDAPRLGPESGLASLIRWEDWTYVSIGNGLHVTFVDRVGREDFQFATPPTTSDLRMASTLRQLAPEEVVNVAREEVPDRYVYDATVTPLDFYYYVAQFRSPRGGTELDIYYGLPTAELQFQPDERGSTYKAQVESGVAVFDTLWNVMGRVTDRTDLVSNGRPNQTRGAIHVDSRAVLIPGGQRVLLSVQAEDLVSGRLQAYQENVDVARFDSTRLSMSDVVVAGAIRKADSTDTRKFVRNGMYIVPMASRAFVRGSPVYVYFELYNLKRGEEYGETEYEIEHAIRSGSSEGGSILGSVGRILGGSQRVGVSRIIEGIRSAEYQNFQIDTSNLAPGTYTLLITVHDLKSDQRVTKDRTFRIGG